MTSDELKILKVTKIEWSERKTESEKGLYFSLFSFGMTLSNGQTFSTYIKTNHDKSLKLDSHTKISRIEIFSYFKEFNCDFIGQIIFYDQNGKIILQSTFLSGLNLELLTKQSVVIGENEHLVGFEAQFVENGIYPSFIKIAI